MQNLNFESNQSSIDNLEAVTYTSVATAGNTPVSVPDAAWYPSSPGRAEGSPSAGVYVKYTGRFAIRNSLIGSLTPKPADTITRGDGSVWTVLRAMPPQVSGVWQLDVIDLILSNGLTQTGSLTRPSNTGQDSAGRQALTSYTTIAASIVCRVQPIGGDAVDLLERRGTPQRFRAFLGQQVTPQALDVFTVSGQAYTVLGFKMPQRIDELMTLDLELIA